MIIQIDYSKNISEQDIKLLTGFTTEYANLVTRKKGSGNGVIDLVTMLEFSFGQLFINYLAKPILESYNKGLINEEYFKELGNKHRTSLMNKLSKITPYFNDVFPNFIKEKKIEEKGILLVEIFDKFQLFICLNEKRMTEELINDFPAALTNTYSIIELGILELEEPKIVQLYPNFEKQIWDYLFIPTNEGFGKFIDKYYCFSENKIYTISSVDEFIKKFNITDLNEYKIIINPRQ